MRTLLLLISIFIFNFSVNANDIEHEELFDKLEPLANTGDSEAQYYLGMMYHLGLGVNKDYTKAYELFRVSELAGHPLSAYKIGCYYAGQGEGTLPLDKDMALKFKIKAAEAGYSFAQYDVSLLMYDLDLTMESIRWLKESAQQGYLYSLLQLSHRYTLGIDVEPDPVLAYAYFLLGMRSTGKQLSEQAVKVLTELKQIMTAEDFKRANEFVLDFEPVRSELTIKAQKGLIPANEYVAAVTSLN